MKKIGVLLVVGSVLLSACGSRDDASTDTSGSGTTTGTTTGDTETTVGETTSGTTTGISSGAVSSDVLAVRVISDRNSIPTGGTDMAHITALVTNAKNQAMTGEVIDFRSSGGVLQGFSTVTDEDGEATATLALAQEFQNQDLTVTVSAGGIDGAIVIAASGSDIALSGPDALVLGDVAEITATLTAGNDQPIANREVVFSSTVGNTITPVSAMTNAEGRATALVESSNGDDTITVRALNSSVIGNHSFKVAADLLAFDEANRGAEFNVNANNTLTVTWQSQGQPVVGEALRFGITAGQLLSPSVVTTDSNGQATITVKSSSAGPATISVEAEVGGDPATQTQVEFVATTPSRVNLEITNSRVYVNETSTVTATVFDANGNPVKNKEVVFSSADLRGGQLNPASAISDSAGKASITFTAGDKATEYNAIELNATVLDTSITTATKLTVVERVLNVTIGSANKITVQSLNTQYSLPFVVQVADGGGTPLPNAEVNVSITPLAYYKGEFYLGDESGKTSNEVSSGWSATSWYQQWAECISEDVNGNRVLDSGEDHNSNGSLDPQDPASLVPTSDTTLATLEGGSLSTDVAGSGYFELVYPVTNAYWAKVKITARAQALGSEADDSFVTMLPMLADALSSLDEPPPNQRSPYGINISTSDPCLDEL